MTKIHNPDTSRILRTRTKLVRAGLNRSAFSETSEALYLNSGFVYDSPQEAEESFDGTRQRFVYSRFRNPTTAVFEDRLAAIESAPADRQIICRSTASGMAAVHGAIMGQVRAGDRVVASRALFGSCDYIIRELLPRFGVTPVFVDGTDLSQWEQALSLPTRCVFLESPSNPTLEVIDIAAVAKLAHQAGAKLIVDNVFATPLLQSPLALGADIVVYSATKHIDGQGRCLGGAILSDAPFINDVLGPYLRNTGPTLAPFNAWILAKGLETFDLRISQHCANALAVARFLESQPKVSRVLYPELPSHPQHELAMSQMKAGGSVVAFELKGGKAAAYDLLDKLQVIDISNNLGDAKSLITHPATTTHQRLSPEQRAEVGVSDSLLRLSVGLEDALDLIEDLDIALKG